MVNFPDGNKARCNSETNEFVYKWLANIVNNFSLDVTKFGPSTEDSLETTLAKIANAYNEALPVKVDDYPGTPSVWVSLFSILNSLVKNLTPTGTYDMFGDGNVPTTHDNVHSLLLKILSVLRNNVVGSMQYDIFCDGNIPRANASFWEIYGKILGISFTVPNPSGETTPEIYALFDRGRVNVAIFVANASEFPAGAVYHYQKQDSDGNWNTFSQSNSSSATDPFYYGSVSYRVIVDLDGTGNFSPPSNVVIMSYSCPVGVITGEFNSDGNPVITLSNYNDYISGTQFDVYRSVDGGAASYIDSTNNDVYIDIINNEFPALTSLVYYIIPQYNDVVFTDSKSNEVTLVIPYDFLTETTQYFEKVDSCQGVPKDTKDKIAVDKFIRGLMDAGYWNQFSWIYLFYPRMNCTVGSIYDLKNYSSLTINGQSFNANGISNAVGQYLDQQTSNSLGTTAYTILADITRLNTNGNQRIVGDNPTLDPDYNAGYMCFGDSNTNGIGVAMNNGAVYLNSGTLSTMGRHFLALTRYNTNVIGAVDNMVETAGSGSQGSAHTGYPRFLGGNLPNESFIGTASMIMVSKSFIGDSSVWQAIQKLYNDTIIAAFTVGDKLTAESGNALTTENGDQLILN